MMNLVSSQQNSRDCQSSWFTKRGPVHEFSKTAETIKVIGLLGREEMIYELILVIAK